MALSEIGVRAIFTGAAQFQMGMAMIRQESWRTSGAVRGMTQNVNAQMSAITRLGSTLTMAGSHIRNWGNMMTNFGLRWSALVTAPIVLSGIAIVDAGVQFEDTMVKIMNLANLTEAEVQSLTDQVLDMAPELGKSPQELLEGLYFIASSGVPDAKTALEVLDVAAKSSAIGLGELNTVAKTLTAIMLSFGIGAEEAADKLVQAVREGQGEADEMAGSLGRVIGIAAAMGLSFDDVAASVATFTRSGVSASVAVTSLRSALLSVANTTTKAEEALNAAGVSSAYLVEQMGATGLARVLTNLTERIPDLEQLGDVFTRRALSGVAFTAIAQAEEYLDVAERVAAANGEVSESFERFAETPKFAFDAFKASVEVLGQRLARVIVPLVADFARKLTDVAIAMAAFARMNPMVIQLAAVFGVLAASIGPVLFLTGSIIGTFGLFVMAIGSVISSIGFLTTLLAIPLLAAFTGAIAVIGTFGVALAATARDIREKMGPSFETLIGRARSWGYGLIVSFANGMIGAFGAIVSVLASLANLIASWLAPGSPPKILPDLDKWGTEAMNVYLKGWTEADFSILSSIGQTISGFIRSLGAAAGTERHDIASAVFGSRKAMIRAVEQFRRTGQVTKATIQSITASFSHSQGIVKDYVRTMFSLEEATRAVNNAQAAIDATNQRFDELLEPFTDRLDELDAFRTEWQRQMHEAELLALLDDPRATEEARRRARLELERLDVLRRIDRIEASREDALTPLEAELQLAKERQEALQAQISAQEELIRLQTELNNLIAETIEKAKELAKPKGSGEGAGDFELEPFEGGGGGGGGGGVELDPLSQFEGGGSIFTPISNFVEQLKEDLQPSIDGLVGSLDDFSTAWANLFTIIANKTDIVTLETVGRVLEDVITAIFDGNTIVRDFSLPKFFLGMRIFAENAIPPLEGLGEALDGLNEAITSFKIENRGLIEALDADSLVWGSILSGMGEAARLAGPPFASLLESITVFVNGVTMLLEGDAQAWITIAAGIVGGIIAAFTTLVVTVIGFISGLVEGIIEFFQNLKKELVGESIVPDMIDDIVAEFVGLPAKILMALGNLVSVVTAPFQAAVDAVVGPNGVLANFGGKVVAKLSGAITAIVPSDFNFGPVVTTFTTLGTTLASALWSGFTGYGILDKLVSYIVRAVIAAISAAARIVPGGNDRSSDGGGTTRSGSSRVSSGIAEGGLALAGTSIPLVAGGRTTEVTVNLGGQNINNGMDLATFRAIIRQEVVRALSV